MKLLVLSHISELLGGAERSILDVLDSWRDQHDIKPEFIMRKPVKSLSKVLDKRGWNYYAFDYGFWSDSNPPTRPEDIFRNAERNSKTVKEIEKIIEETNPDVVITNSVVCPWAALAAHFQGVPHVWFVREYGDLDHGREFEIGRSKTFEDVGSLSELVVANSKTLEVHLNQYIDKDKLTTLYTPFNLSGIKDRSDKKVKNPFKYKDSLKLITTNNIAPTKGQLEAAEAVGKLNEAGENVELCIMGAGNKEHIDEIKSTARRYQALDKIHFTGSQPDTVPYIALADIGIMASRKEAFGRATFECLAAGKPVIGANSGATPEMVKHGENGYLYKQGDSDSLASEIKRYLNNRDLLEAHSKSARQTTEEMMRSEYNVDSAYEKVRIAVENGKEYSGKPINYLHRWFDYAEAGGATMRKAYTFSFTRILGIKVKGRLKPAYFWLRGLLARTTGR